MSFFAGLFLFNVVLKRLRFLSVEIVKKVCERFMYLGIALFSVLFYMRWRGKGGHNV